MTATDWEGFAAAFVSTLRGLSERNYLIISAAQDQRRFVQLAVESDHAHVEASGHADGIDESKIVEAGWKKPHVAPPNWEHDLKLPALTSARDRSPLCCRSPRRIRRRITG